MKLPMLALAVATLSTPAFAQKPGHPVYAPMANYGAVSISDNASLCANVLKQYPADHLRLTVQHQPAIRVDCGIHQSQSPVIVTFETLAGLDWYRTHEGHRDILPGETHQD